MKHLIIAAALSLVAAPAFAGPMSAIPQPKTKTVTITETQMGGERFNPDSARDVRNAAMRRAVQDRSYNGRAAWAGQPHYY